VGGGSKSYFYCAGGGGHSEQYLAELRGGSGNFGSLNARTCF
jgi:hypothetical protein